MLPTGTPTSQQLMDKPIEQPAWYLLGVIFLVGLAAAISVFIVRPNQDNAVLILGILGFTTTSIATLGGFMRTYTAVNSRMDDFKQTTLREFESRLEQAVTTAFVAGQKDGIASANVRTDDLAAQKRAQQGKDAKP